MEDGQNENNNYIFRLLIKRPSWGYSKEDIALMTREERYQHIYNPLHDAAVVGGMYMQLESPEGNQSTYIFKPRTKSTVALSLFVTALKASTALSFPGKVYPCKERLFYDDEIAYTISKEQYTGIKEELERGNTKLFNYALHDSGIYATRIAAEYGINIPDLGLLSPLEFYRTAHTMPHRISIHSSLLPRQDLTTIFPRDVLGGTLLPFAERIKLQQLHKVVAATGGVC